MHGILEIKIFNHLILNLTYAFYVKVCFHFDDSSQKGRFILQTPHESFETLRLIEVSDRQSSRFDCNMLNTMRQRDLLLLLFNS